MCYDLHVCNYCRLYGNNVWFFLLYLPFIDSNPLSESEITTIGCLIMAFSISMNCEFYSDEFYCVY